MNVIISSIAIVELNPAGLDSKFTAQRNLQLIQSKPAWVLTLGVNLKQ